MLSNNAAVVGAVAAVALYCLVANPIPATMQYTSSATRAVPATTVAPLRQVQPVLPKSGTSTVAPMMASSNVGSTSSSSVPLLAAFSGLTAAVLGMFYAAGRLTAKQPQAVPMTMLSMGDDDNDLFGLLGLAESAGLPGAIAPLDYFDPLGLSKDKDIAQLKLWRESELKHGRVAMLAAVGFPLAEQFHPLFGGSIDAPSAFAVADPQLLPLWLALVPAFWFLEQPTLGAFNEATDGTKKLKENFKPGNYGFDPLGLAPINAPDLEAMECKELSNGRLAMLAIMGMIAQELVTHQKLF